MIDIRVGVGVVGAQHCCAPAKIFARFRKLALPECQANEESGSFARWMDFWQTRISDRPIFRNCAAVRGMVYDASKAPVAQLDRASGFEPEGREFESLRARHSISRNDQD